MHERSSRGESIVYTVNLFFFLFLCITHNLFRAFTSNGQTRKMFQLKCKSFSAITCRVQLVVVFYSCYILQTNGDLAVKRQLLIFILINSYFSQSRRIALHTSCAVAASAYTCDSFHWLGNAMHPTTCAIIHKICFASIVSGKVCDLAPKCIVHLLLLNQEQPSEEQKGDRSSQKYDEISRDERTGRVKVRVCNHFWLRSVLRRALSGGTRRGG